MALKEIKKKIRSVNKTRKVTKAMEAVSAVKMRKSQAIALEGRSYAHSALTILRRVSGSVDGARHVLAQKRDVHTICIVVVTSDKGLAGNLNNGVLKKATKLVEDTGLAKEQLRIVSIGKKGYEYFSKRGFKIEKNYENLGDNISTEDMKAATETLLESFINKIYDECYIVYTNFRSTLEQEPVVQKILPISVDVVRETVDAIKPTHGAFTEEPRESERTSEYTIEPTPEEVLDELLPFLLNIEVHHALLEAKASEHSARMVAMKNATDKAADMSKELTLTFNKERQALITREVSEIIGGIETMPA